MSDSILESDMIIKELEEDIDDYDLGDYSIGSASYNFSFENIDFNYLISRNSNTVAWIKVDGTYINYPILQYSDNEYYLEHDINDYQTNVGWIYADYRSNFDNFKKNTIIYGHNLTNRTMFGSLPFVLKSNWYKNKNNYYVKMATVNYNTVWEVFSVYKIEPVVDYLRTNFGSSYEYGQWLNLMKSRSIYDFGVDVNSNDRILTLSTCDDIGNKRVVLQAKLVSVLNK